VAVKFAIFSTDKGATANPWGLNPQPTTMIDLGEDPLNGEFDVNAGVKGRGCRIATLGGAVDQDFGVNIKDQRIRIQVQDSPIAAATLSAIDSAYSTVDGEYYLTDSVSCWKVKFEKPDGVKIARNLFWKAQNVDVFSYELIFKVNSKDV